MKKILLMPTLLATTVAPISFLATLTSCGKAANITFESNNILYLEDVQNKANEDYVGKITLNEEFKGRYDIPQTNCYYEVKVGDNVIDNYDVDQVGDQNDYYATITIPKDELKDNNKVTITAKECPRYLCFEAISEGADVGYEIKGNIDVQIQICEDINTPSPEWVDWDGQKQELSIGEKLYVRNKTNMLSIDGSNYFKFNVTNNKKILSVTGNTMSMINFQNLSTYCFNYLFNGMPLHNTVPILPASKLKEYCYYFMFSNVEHLNAAPELPATTLAPKCYSKMFYECKALKIAPELPALKLANECYECMFERCYSLESAPELPAIEVAEKCYECMFEDCWSLQSTPKKLPAIKLAKACYECMFEDCWSLQSSPELPATELAEYCYSCMFDYCYSFKSAPKLPAMNLSYSCYQYMFECCYSLTIAPELPAIKLAEDCYYSMFSQCYSLNNAPNLPAKTLPARCYYCMFDDCLSLRVSDKNGTKKIFECSNSTDDCVRGMFDGCVCDFEEDPQIGTTYYCL